MPQAYDPGGELHQPALAPGYRRRAGFRSIETVGAGPARGRARARARERFAQLTHRDTEVMSELITGAANKVVARTLGLSPRTVEFHRARVFEKTGVQSVAELVRLAFEADIEG